MTRQEMCNIITENKWNDEVKKKYGRPYISCSNDALATFIAEKHKGKSDAPKKPEQPVAEKPKQKTQEEILQDVLSRVDKYKESTRKIRENSQELETYTKLLEDIKQSYSFVLTTDSTYTDRDTGCIQESSIKMVFDDSEFIRELLICFVTERINKLMDSIEETQNRMKSL